MRALSVAVLLSVASSLSHAGAFTGDVDIAGAKGGTTFAADTTRSIQAVSKFDYFFYASDFRSSIKDLYKQGIDGLGTTNIGSVWGGSGGDDCGVSVPEPSTALLLIPGMAYLMLRRKKTGGA